MLILTAENKTKSKRKPVLVRPDGTSDYAVWVGLNHFCIWKGNVRRHKRANGAAALLRKIADAMDADQQNQDPKTVVGDDGDYEWSCPHNVGHGPHVHTCDGCCLRDSGYKAWTARQKQAILDRVKATRQVSDEDLVLMNRFGMEPVFFNPTGVKRLSIKKP